MPLITSNKYRKLGPGFKPGLLHLAQFLALSLLLLFQSSCFALNKKIAITIDDLPFVGEYRNFHLNLIIQALQKEQVPATGFVIAREIRPANWDTLYQFRDAGFSLGNHTFSHANLNEISAKRYIQEIKKADKILKPILTKPKYFRYPYLAVGTGKKRDKVMAYLKKHHYHIAPITIDSKDFVFNQRLLAIPELQRRAYLEELKPFYLDFIWQQTQKAEKAHPNAQILLIHSNLLNAYVLPDILQLYQEHGYTFVSLKKALVAEDV